ncbi:MAG: DUF4038 domain-containing protein [Armatimonadota bacterium]|nr:DUF4038 domain-containing protein [Armatimonadota bacterium]
MKVKGTFASASRPIMAALAFFFLSAASAAAALVFDDPLTTGTTIGVRDNGQGQFVSGGWKVTSHSDNIRYTPPTPIEDGAVEFDVIGLKPSDTQNPDGMLMAMYDASSGNPRFANNLTNPWRFAWHRFGNDPGGHSNEFKMFLTTHGMNQYDDFAQLGAYTWSQTVTYHFKVTWRDGVFRYYVNGTDANEWPFIYREVYRPATHDIRIGSDTTNKAITDAVYSNVKIYDYAAAPIAPYIKSPANGISKSLTPIIDWTGERHDRFEVHVATSSDPNTGIVWDSGEVVSSNSYCVSGSLLDNTAYYTHVRLRNDKGWGAWASKGFTTSQSGTAHISKYGEYEAALTTTNNYANPYTQVTLSATFTGPTKTITVNGFWDGGNLYKIRMMPTEPGTWSWTTTSNDSQLNGRTGSFVCDGSTSKGYVKVSTAYPYTFEWTDGTPFFLLGDTMWHIWYNIRYSDGALQGMMDARSAQHFNQIQGVLHAYCHNEGGGIYSVQDPSGGRWDCDKLNPDYFKWVDEKVNYMNSKGIVATLFFSWGNEGYKEYNSPNQYINYIKYLVSRYASKNVFWVIVGEYEEAGESDSNWISYMNTVYNNDPYKHPISMHTIHNTNDFGNVTAHSFIGQQHKATSPQMGQYVADSRIFNKPVVNLEYGYESTISGKPIQLADEVRQDHYAISLSGGYGVYGNALPGFLTYHVSAGFNPLATETIGAEYMKILYEFFEETSFHRLSPSQGLVSAGICSAWADNEYIVQLLAGGSVTVNLSAASGTFYVDWFDPRIGVRYSSGTTTGGASRVFTAPGANDWILHIHKNVIPPRRGRAIGFAAAAGDGRVCLSWTNPSDSDFTGTMIRYDTVGYPTDPADGFLLIDKANTPGSNDAYIHNGLTNGTRYYYSAFSHNGAPEYAGGVSASAMSAPCANLSVKTAGSITIDGNPGDWNLPEFATYIRGGQTGTGDTALVGYDGGTLYYGGYWTGGVLPASAADHTAKVYSRADSTYQYFLVRCDDDQMNFANPASANWANDCVEFYIDPSNNHGSASIINSTSDFQLVIDCDNQKNVYQTTGGYATTVLTGVTSSVVRDSTGWWAEVRIQKSATDPNMLANGIFGVDFAFRDNDNPDATYFYGSPDASTMYGWSDNTIGAGFPSKIPDKWGDAVFLDTTPPAPITNFAATPGDQQITLSWTNPNDPAFAGVMIRHKTTGYPTSATDGEFVLNRLEAPGANSSFTHIGLTNGVTYYYRAFSFDSASNYNTSTSVTVSSSPIFNALWLNEIFDPYNNGNLGGQGNWLSEPGVTNAQVQSAVAAGGSGKSALLDSAAAVGTVMNTIQGFPKRNSGYQYLSFDLLLTWSGSSSLVYGGISIYPDDYPNEIARLDCTAGTWTIVSGSGTATLQSPVTQNTWYNIKLGFDFTQRRIEVWVNGVKKPLSLFFNGSGTNISRIVVSTNRVTALSAQKLYVDNIRGETSPPAPIAVTDDGAYTGSLTRLHCSWTSGGVGASKYQYGIGTLPGLVNVTGWTNVESATEVIDDGLSLLENRTYYFTVKAGNSYGVWSSAVNSNGIKTAYIVTLQGSKNLPNGLPTEFKGISGGVVSAVFSDCFYIQDPDMPFGLRVTPAASVAVSNEVDVAGIMKGANSERYIDITGNTPIVIIPGPGEPGPLGMTNFALGGSVLNDKTPGVDGGVGLNNIGSLVRVFGRVSPIDSTSFWVDDGSGPVKVLSGDLVEPTGTPYVVVTGISVLDTSVSPAGRAIRPRTQADIVEF